MKQRALTKEEQQKIKEFSHLKIHYCKKENCYKISLQSIKNFVGFQGSASSFIDDVRKKVIELNNGELPTKTFGENINPATGSIGIHDAIFVSILYDKRELLYYLNRFRLAKGMTNGTV